MDIKIASLATLMTIAMSTTATKAQKNDDPFLKIGTDVTTYGEFSHLFEQNGGAALLPIGKEEYATIFTNYKLKVAEAKALGIDTTQNYRDEYEYYVGELSKSYLVDTTAIGRFAQRERARSSEEIHAAHILITCRPSALPADTLAAYKRAAAARARILRGEDFATVAKETSDDPSAKENGGDLGYFTSLQMVQEFEDAAFATPAGQTSEIVRTRFGYHFIHVYDRRPCEGEIRVKHIMKRIAEGATEADKAKAKALIDSIYDAIVNHGADFDKMARQFSDDRPTATRGGLMQWFTRSQILPSFSNAAFALEADGDISKPVLTVAGWHIICRVGRRNEIPKDEYDAMIKRLQTSSRAISKIPKRAQMAKLAKEYGFAWDAAGRDTLIGIMLRNGSPAARKKAANDIAAQPIGVLDGKPLTMADALPHIGKWSSSGMPYENAMDIIYSIVNDYEKGRLEQKFPEYRFTCTEYRDGLLVFELMQRQIWKNAPDSTAIARQFASHPERYSAGGKFEGEIYFCPTIKAADKVRKLVAKGQKTKAAAMATRVVSGPISQGDIYDDFLWPMATVSPYVVVSGQVTNGQRQKLSECRNRVVSDMQQIAEQKLVDDLRVKYKPKQLIKIK